MTSKERKDLETFLDEEFTEATRWLLDHRDRQKQADKEFHQRRWHWIFMRYATALSVGGAIVALAIKAG